MKNIPVFTACGGTATLLLKDIPKTGRSYVILQTSVPGMETLQARECAIFCRMAGAREVYVSSAMDKALELPHSHDLLRMTLHRTQRIPPGRQIDLLPVTDPQEYILSYNLRFSPLPNAAILDETGYEVAVKNGVRHVLAYHKSQLIGLGAVWENRLEAVASLVPGWGQDVTYALMEQIEGDTVELTVCSDNLPAIRLYERLGFQVCSLISRWYVCP